MVVPSKSPIHSNNHHLAIEARFCRAKSEDDGRSYCPLLAFGFQQSAAEMLLVLANVVRGLADEFEKDVRHS
jgi:hypothetical protein